MQARCLWHPCHTQRARMTVPLALVQTMSLRSSGITAPGNSQAGHAKLHEAAASTQPLWTNSAAVRTPAADLTVALGFTAAGHTTVTFCFILPLLQWSVTVHLK